MPSLKDISRKTGLSVATVSNALNDRQGYSHATKQLVCRTAEELGYTANPLARGLLLGKGTATVALLWSLGGPHQSVEMVRDITLRMQNRGFTTHLMDSLSDPEVVRRQLAECRRRGVDAVVLQYEGVLMTTDICCRLKEFSAAVAVGAFEPLEAMDWVHHDLPMGYRQAADSLADAGRVRPAILCNAGGSGYKIKAFLGQCSQRGMIVSDGSVIDFSIIGRMKQWRVTFRQVLEERFASEFPFDALICTCDEWAAMAMGWLRGRGLRVPEDVAVIGCNNAILSESVSPPLASIERNDEKVAAAIEEMVFSRLADLGLPARRQDVAGQFVRRESAG
jgi:DNA-binding LacI/PurR family transcriptional regulator